MANGNGGVPRIPGFSAAWGVSLSNTAIVVGGLALLAVTWLSMNKNGGSKMAIPMDDESLGRIVEGDVLAYAASPQSVHENRDRIRDAISRVRDTFRAAREAYTKKIRDLAIARQKGLITNVQFQAQHRAALVEFKAAIKARHREIMNLLNIPHFAQSPTVTPTTS